MASTNATKIGLISTWPNKIPASCSAEHMTIYNYTFVKHIIFIRMWLCYTALICFTLATWHRENQVCWCFVLFCSVYVFAWVCAWGWVPVHMFATCVHVCVRVCVQCVCVSMYTYGVQTANMHAGACHTDLRDFVHNVRVSCLADAHNHAILKYNYVLWRIHINTIINVSQDRRSIKPSIQQIKYFCM